MASPFTRYQSGIEASTGNLVSASQYMASQTANAINSIGDNISKGLEKYYQNKDIRETAIAKGEALAGHIQTYYDMLKQDPEFAPFADSVLSPQIKALSSLQDKNINGVLGTVAGAEKAFTDFSNQFQTYQTVKNRELVRNINRGLEGIPKTEKVGTAKIVARSNWDWSKSAKANVADWVQKYKDTQPNGDVGTALRLWLEDMERDIGTATFQGVGQGETESIRALIADQLFAVRNYLDETKEGASPTPYTSQLYNMTPDQIKEAAAGASSPTVANMSTPPASSTVPANGVQINRFSYPVRVTNTATGQTAVVRPNEQFPTWYTAGFDSALRKMEMIGEPPPAPAPAATPPAPAAPAATPAAPAAPAPATPAATTPPAPVPVPAVPPAPAAPAVIPPPPTAAPAPAPAAVTPPPPPTATPAGITPYDALAPLVWLGMEQLRTFPIVVPPIAAPAPAPAAVTPPPPPTATPANKTKSGGQVIINLGPSGSAPAGTTQSITPVEKPSVTPPPPPTATATPAAPTPAPAAVPPPPTTAPAATPVTPPAEAEALRKVKPRSQQKPETPAAPEALPAPPTAAPEQVTGDQIEQEKKRRAEQKMIEGGAEKTPEGELVYTIKKGDTIKKVADKLGLTVKALEDRAKNSQLDAYRFRVGDVISLKEPPVTTAPAKPNAIKPESQKGRKVSMTFDDPSVSVRPERVQNFLPKFIA